MPLSIRLHCRLRSAIQATRLDVQSDIAALGAARGARSGGRVCSEGRGETQAPPACRRFRGRLL